MERYDVWKNRFLEVSIYLLEALSINIITQVCFCNPLNICWDNAGRADLFVFTLIRVETVLLLLCLILKPACIHRSDILSTLDRMKCIAGPLLLLMTSYSGLRVVRISACVQ